MSSNGYNPRPIDTSAVRLPREIEEMREKLACNAHEIWAKQRKDEGWRWGPTVDDEMKLHPCMVPYEQLPETEKDYDRLIAMETLRVVLALGFQIERQ
jgi:RyR domain